jgi:hypothetical protein
VDEDVVDDLPGRLEVLHVPVRQLGHDDGDLAGGVVGVGVQLAVDDLVRVVAARDRG